MGFTVSTAGNEIEIQTCYISPFFESFTYLDTPDVEPAGPSAILFLGQTGTALMPAPHPRRGLTLRAVCQTLLQRAMWTVVAIK